MRVVIKKGFSGGSINVPPSKSLAHRALICASLSNGKSCISGIISSDDMFATIDAMRALGAVINYDETSCTANVEGIFTNSNNSLNLINSNVNCNESGSTLRFLIPLFSLTNKPVNFICKGRLAQRPQGVYSQLFKQQGLVFNPVPTGIFINGALTCGEYVIDGSVSSQFISGLLFALPLLNGNSTIKITAPLESRSYINLTIQAMRDFGVHVNWTNEYTISILGNQIYNSCNYDVEGDCSQAAFWAVMGTLINSKNSIQLTGLRHNTLQGDSVIFDMLANSGAIIADTRETDGKIKFAPNITTLKATEKDIADCPDLGPILTALALFCNGNTVIRNAGRLRIKESDRIQAMEQELEKMGAKIRSDKDNIYIDGKVELKPSTDLSSHNDHRIVMALCVVCVVLSSFNSQNNFFCSISGAQAVNKSYPLFFEHLKSLGCNITLIDD